MANDLKGEVRFEVDGEAYKLRFTTNALYEHFERPMGFGFTSILEKFEARSVEIGTIRQMLFAGLMGSCTAITISETGDLIDLLGYGKTFELLSDAFIAAFGNEERPKKKPRK